MRRKSKANQPDKKKKEKKPSRGNFLAVPVIPNAYLGLA